MALTSPTFCLTWALSLLAIPRPWRRGLAGWLIRRASPRALPQDAILIQTLMESLCEYPGAWGKDVAQKMVLQLPQETADVLTRGLSLGLAELRTPNAVFVSSMPSRLFRLDGAEKVVDALFSRGWEWPLKHRDTPLGYAAYKGSQGVVNMLLKRGHDPLVFPPNGRHALSALCEQGSDGNWDELMDLLAKSMEHYFVPDGRSLTAFFLLQQHKDRDAATAKRLAQVQAWKLEQDSTRVSSAPKRRRL